MLVASKFGFWPEVSKLPLLSRSHAYVRGTAGDAASSSRSVPDPLSALVESPSSKTDGPCASAVGGSLAGEVLVPPSALTFIRKLFRSSGEYSDLGSLVSTIVG